MVRNPFHVLGLPTGATTSDIVERAKELDQLAETEEERRLARVAMQELITHPETSRLHVLLEVPGARYRDKEWQAFDRRHRKPPVDSDALAASGAPLRTESFDIGAVIGYLLDGMLSPPPVDIRPAIADAPVQPGLGAPPIGVNDVIFG